MSVVRKLPATLIVTGGVAVGLAGPAWADELNGTYNFNTSNGAGVPWSVTSCGAGCANVSMTPGAPWAPYGGKATRTGSQWTLTVHRPDGMRCNADQSVSVPVTTTFTWGDGSLSGAATTTVDAAGCDYDAGTTWSDSFNLTKA